MIKFMLDTNICIYIAKYNPPPVRERFTQHAANELAMSVITLGELRFGAEKSVWHLDQDTRAVTHQLIGTHRTPVVQVFKNLQRLRHDGVRFGTFDMSHKAHTTSVVLLSWVVQTRLLQS